MRAAALPVWQQMLPNTHLLLGFQALLCSLEFLLPREEQEENKDGEVWRRRWQQGMGLAAQGHLESSDTDGFSPRSRQNSLGKAFKNRES